MEKTIKEINEKYHKLGEDPKVYLNGLLHAKPLTYWDYIEVDTLLSLQKPKTHFKDESIFIMYHQLTELALKMLLHELSQLTGENEPDERQMIEKLERMQRYTHLLITSFDIMKTGMRYEDYNIFRQSLTPASGFQSVQFRFVELHATSLPNLLNSEGKKRLCDKPEIEDYFKHIYWKDAGLNRKTGAKTITLKLFEDKYLEELTRLAKKLQGQTLQDKLDSIEKPSEKLISLCRQFDYFYNVEWPLVHLDTAQHYLDQKEAKSKAATGGSEWKKYLHPHYQQRKFFPKYWTTTEIKNWGISKPKKL